MKMTMEAAEQFLRMLGVQNIQKDMARGWIRASCPLAPWRHSSGRDRNPSFGIKISDKAPFYHCFSCGAQGMLPKLVATLNWLENDPHKEASEFLGQYELFGEGTADATSIKVGRRIRITDRFNVDDRLIRSVRRPEPVPAEVLARLPLIEDACEYSACEDITSWLVNVRKISLQSIADYQLRAYDSNHGVGVVFPLISRKTNAVMDLWVRMIYGDSHSGSFRLTPELMDSPVNYHAPNMWFGQHLYVPDRPLILVEGAIDAMRLRSLFPSINVMACMGQPSNEQLAAIHGRVVIMGYDADQTGKRFALRTYKAVNALKVAWINWAEVGINDPGELENEAQFRAAFDKRKVWDKTPKNPDPVRTRRIRTKKDKPRWL